MHRLIQFCIGCLSCQKTQKCVLNDDANLIAEKVKDADTLVFATPIYYYEMSGQMKTLLDMPDVEVVSVCDLYPDRVEKAQEKVKPLTVNYVGECEKALTKQLGRKVKIVNGKRKGRFELEFYGQEDLQKLLDALMKIK